MTPADRALAVRRATAALELVRIAEERGYELDQAGSSGVYVAVIRQGSAVHVIAGEPGEVLDKVKRQI